MRVVRYFGNHTGAANGRNILCGQLVLDVRPHLNRSVTVDSLGATYTLGEWIERHRLPPADPDYVNISLLFYNQLAAVGSGAMVGPKGISWGEQTRLPPRVIPR